MQFWSLTSELDYEAVKALQLKLVDLRAQDLIEDTVLFLEHRSVVTRGRGLQFTGAPRARHMPLPIALPPKISFSESERGGDLTYHGPGQLVIYPICKLDGLGFGPHHDVAAFLRKIESAMISVLSELGIKALTKENATGVWVGEKKIASLGIAIKRWVTYHGIAINAVNDLSPFHLFSPCGFAPEVMTNLNDYGVKFANVGTWRADLEMRFARVLGGEKIHDLELSEALAICERLSLSHPGDQVALFSSTDHRETRPASSS